MSLYVGIGTSKNLQDAYTSGQEAARLALENAKGGKVSVAIVFASTHFNQEEMLKGVKETLGDISIIGCSSSGAITSEGAQEQAISVMVLGSDEGVFTPIKVTGIGKDIRAAGRSFGEQLKAIDDTARLAFLFSDALSGNGTELVRGVLDVLGTDFVLSGGAAGDDMNFKKTYQYFNGEVLTDSAVGLGVSKEISFVAGADHGWQPIGNGRVVTKAEGTKVIELDGKPAFEIYQDYFGERAGDFKKALSLAAVTYPLGMKASGSEEIMVRAPLVVGDDGSIICGAEILEGSKVFLMIGTMNDALGAAESKAKELMGKMPDTKKRIVFVSDCVARKILLGERGKEEIELLKSIAGPESEIFGFYSYGQISPLHTPTKDVNTCDPGFYEQSISITILGA